MTDEASVVGELPPPRADDVLFGPGSDWQANACVNYMFPYRGELAYRIGFRRAAFQLAVQVCETAQGQDYLVYPIVYLYRHHVELALKAIIDSSSYLVSRKLSSKDKRTLGSHHLANLWALAAGQMNDVCETVGNRPFPSANLEGIASYIRQLHDHDPDGQRFRYATVRAARHGNSLPADLKLINIRDFADALERLVDYLEGVASWFDHLVEEWAEQEREASGY